MNISLQKLISLPSMDMLPCIFNEFTRSQLRQLAKDLNIPQEETT